MTCPGSGSTGTKTANWPFENWARTQKVSVPTVYHPTSVQEIVAAVLEVEDRQENVKAIGSGWAYGAVAVDESTKNVIATRGLQKKLSGSDPTKGMIPFALRDELKPPPTRYLHVEAGIEIWRLSCMLDEQLLAMPTLCASNGQTIAGAIATSTHGTDVDAAPIADAVAATHLVGPGGREWWIERDEDAGAITGKARMAQAQAQGRLCPDARVEYDTSLFRAVLVSMGRMGVVYSYVLTAVDRFALTMTRNVNAKWSVERAKLRDPLKPFVDDDGPARPLAVAVSGLALPALGLVPDVSDVDFGTVAVGDKSKARRVTLTNRSTAAASVTDVLIQGPSAAEVIILATNCTGAALAPGASCAVRLQLTPASIGTRSATLTTSADVTAHEATLHGLGAAALMGWLPGPLDFGNMNVGAQTPTQDSALRNTGNAPAAILSVDVAGDAADFVVTELTPGITALQPTGIKGFRIRFKPTAPGTGAPRCVSTPTPREARSSSRWRASA